MVDFTEEANRRAAGRDWVLQAAALLKLFTQAHGHAPTRFRDVDAWAKTANLELPVDPYSILTTAEANDALRKVSLG